MELDWTNIILAFLSGGVASAIITAIANKRNQDADTTQRLASAYSNLVNDLEKNNLENEAARKADKVEFEAALAAMQAKYDIALAALQAKYDALDLRFATLEKERDSLLHENWELQRRKDKGNE